MNKDLDSSQQILFTGNQDDIPWDIEVDVLVIGGGGCGLTASLAAAQKGAQTLVIEKEKEAAGNTALSQAMVPAAGTIFQKEAGIDDSIELMTNDILNKNSYGSDPELTRHVVQESARFIEWLYNTLGIRLDLVTDFLYPGHSQYRIHANDTKKGAHLMNDLLQVASQYDNLDIAYNAIAERLVVNSTDGAVLGAEVTIEGIGKNLARAKNVILALNGFGANKQMLAEYIPEMKDAYYFGHEGNTGEGILWGKALGAELDCMNAYQAHGSVAYPHGTLLTYVTVSMGGYHVNLEGRRFVNEYHGYSEHALDVLSQKEGIAISIFDDKIYQAIKDYDDMQQCIQMGAIRSFDNIRNLAESFGLPVDVTEETHEAFIKAAKGISTDTFGREYFEKILEAPLYAAKVTGALFHTQGGLKINKNANVLKSNGNIISNLFAGGGTAVGFSGKSGPSGYLSGNGLMAALVLGKIAGESAAINI